MDVPVPVLVLAAVVMRALGGYLAIRLPMAIRQAGDSMTVKVLGGMLLGGGACGLLGLGGAIIAALVGAAPVAVGLSIAFIVATGLVALSVLGFTTYGIWRRVTHQRGEPTTRH